MRAWLGRDKGRLEGSCWTGIKEMHLRTVGLSEIKEK
jgi:hypothetical protein